MARIFGSNLVGRTLWAEPCGPNLVGRTLWAEPLGPNLWGMDTPHNLPVPLHLIARVWHRVLNKLPKWVRRAAVLAFWLGAASPALVADARFDLVGPKVDVRVTRGPDTLPIASVPNLQPGDRLWLHPDLPPSQSAKYLLICVFLRGSTNPPPENWFYRIETWNKKVQAEGTYITVPAEAQQAVLFMAPETGGDFATLKSAVRGRPGVFVRASQDLSEAGFEQARIERYLAGIRHVPPSDAADLQKHSDLLARTLNLKPNPECFKRPVDQQFPCLTQTGSQLLMDDGHAQNVVASLSSGANSDLISQASYTRLAGSGSYSAYVGAIVDFIRIMGNLHTAQYQYIPAIAFPQGEALNLRVNTPPSFHNPKSVLVIALPSIQEASKPPLQPSDPNFVACLLKPSVVLPLEGAPLVFSTDFATQMVLHPNTPPGAPLQPDIPLIPDAFEGGLRLEPKPEHHVQITDVRQPLDPTSTAASAAPSNSSIPVRAMPVELTGTIQGRWGFDPFTGPTLKLQQLPGSDWHIVGADGSAAEVIAGKTAELFVTSTGSACVHTVTAQPSGTPGQLPLTFKSSRDADHPNRLAVSLPAGHEIPPGNLHLAIQQYGQPQPDSLQTLAFTDPAHIVAVELAAGDRSLLLRGSNLGSVTKLTLGDLVFRPDPAAATEESPPAPDSLHLSLPTDSPAPPTHPGEHLRATLSLNDGRELPLSLTVASARPALNLLSRTFVPAPGTVVNLSNGEDLPLDSHVDFTLKSQTNFPRNGQVEVATPDGSLHTVLTLAPSGGLVLQDPHTVVASLDPLRSFGPSAFGALRVRAIFPPGKSKGRHPEDGTTADANSTAAQNTETDPLATSDWLPLGTLVRLPVLTRLQCAPDPASPCNLSGSSLYLLQAVSADPAFAQPNPVPDGFTGNVLQVPHPAGSSGTLFLKLRDDPTPIDIATVPTSTGSAQPGAARTHSASAAPPRRALPEP